HLVAGEQHRGDGAAGRAHAVVIKRDGGVRTHDVDGGDGAQLPGERVGRRRWRGRGGRADVRGGDSRRRGRCRRRGFVGTYRPRERGDGDDLDQQEFRL